MCYVTRINSVYRLLSPTLHGYFYIIVRTVYCTVNYCGEINFYFILIYYNFDFYYDAIWGNSLPMAYGR